MKGQSRMGKTLAKYSFRLLNAAAHC